MQQQLQHSNTIFEKIDHPLILLCDAVNSPANMGGLLRISDSFGVEKVIFGNAKVNLNSPRLKKTARATQNKVNVETTDNVLVTLQNLLSKKYTPIALEITKKSIAIQQVNYHTLGKIVLIIGDENTGISEEVLNMCNYHVHITMFGENSSMNVTQATAIALYEITKQL